MASLVTKKLSFTYTSGNNPALDKIDLEIADGEFVLLCGSSGCGKTTLLRSFKRGLCPVGTMSGEVFFDSHAVSELSERESALRCGFVTQEPKKQLVCDTVRSELAFSCEELGLPPEKTAAAVAETAAYFGLSDILYKECRELSGGYIQLLVIAAALVLSPDTLLLDEPASSLDPIETQKLFELLRRINHDFGTTIVVSGHNAGSAMRYCDRVAVLESGRLLFVADPESAARMILESSVSDRIGGSLPEGARAFYPVIPKCEHLPLTVRDGKRALSKYKIKNCTLQSVNTQRALSAPALISAKEAFFRYHKSSGDIIKGLSLSLFPGEILAVCGANGSGKSTLLGVLSGLLRPWHGKVKKRDGVRTSLLFQDTAEMFFEETVESDLYAYALDVTGDKKAAHILAEKQLDEFSLLELRDRTPFDLSGGERQRAALCKLFTVNSQVFLLDEPTKGVDSGTAAMLGGLLKKIANSGGAVLLVSHDMEFCARYATHAAMISCGEMTLPVPARDFFASNSYFTCDSAKIAHDGHTVLYEELSELCR